MTLSAVMKNARDTARISRSDISEYVNRRRAASVVLPPHEAQLVRSLRADGCVVVPNYWEHDRALAMKERLEAFLAEGKSRDYDSGAYLVSATTWRTTRA